MPSDCLRRLFLLTFCVGASFAPAADWTAGSSPVIGAGENVTISAPQPNIVRFTDNGTLAFAAGGSVALTGAVTTAVGSGSGGQGVLTMAGGSSITNQGSGYFVVGYLGGTGSVTIASGAVWRSNSGRFRLAGNEEGQRSNPSYGEVAVAGALISDILDFTGFFPTNLTPPYADCAKLTLNAGGVVEVGQLQKNDCANSTFLFNGGTLRMRQDSSDFISGRGVMAIVFADGTNAVFDTNGKTVTVNPLGAPYDAVLTIRGEAGEGKRGDGGLVKAGAGALVLRLPAACNTFTGAVTVLQGTLDLGRPLADSQRVTVYAGASFVVRSTNDLNKITFLDGGSGSRMLYTVAVDTDSLNLTALNAIYYDDRLAGPFSGTATLSNTLTHAAGTVGAPFRLIGQGGTLNLTNTALETSVLQVEGTGTFNFMGSRAYAAADAGKLVIADGGYRQDQTFALADASGATPASFALATGRFSAGSSLDVGVNGYGALAANGAAVAAGRLRVGGGTGFTGSISQAAGTVTLSGESYVGMDGGSGSLVVTGGQFIVNNADLRLASNPGINTALRPQGGLTVSNALFRCNRLYMTSWWPTDGSAKTVESGVLTLLAGGVAEVNDVYKNDDPVCAIVFNGGLLRARAASGSFLNAAQQYGTLRVQAAAGQHAVFDTQGYSVTVAKSVGTLTFSGAGGLKKQGGGALTFSASQVAYAGDTVVEAGTLRLGAADQIPDGPGTGHVQVAANAVFDLYGRNETVNRLIGQGIVCSTNAPATLGVLADGSDDTWSRAWLLGPVTLDKRGAGTLTLAAGNSVPTNLIVSAGTVKTAAAVGFPFYRFKVEGVKNPATANSMQFSEIALFSDGVNVTSNRIGILYDSTGGVGNTPDANAFPANEMPEKVVDGIVYVGTSTGNKWLDFRAKSSRTAEDKARVWLRIDFPSVQKITHYNWATGNDAVERDPAAWRLQGSYDGVTWTDLDVQSNYVATATRNAWVTANGFPVNAGNATAVLNPCARVTVASGAGLLLNGVSEKIAGLGGLGTVTLSNASLTVDSPAGTESRFYGALAGNGAFRKIGAGTQGFSATNLFAAGGVTVSNGCLTVLGGAAHTWFRFTIRENKADTNVTQVSELALCSSDGVRRNAGLALGSGVASLLPGQFACPEAYSIGSSGESPEKLFDANTATKWCPNNNYPTPGNPATYRTVVMRLAEDVPEIAGYNLCTANDVPERDPSDWTLESSADGSAWHTVDARTGIVPPVARFTWYNGGDAYALTSRAVADADRNVIADSAVVEVRAGAALSVLNGHDAIGALRVDMLSAGTLNTFAVAPNGTLYVVNASGAPAGLVLPLTIGEVVDAGNLKSWTVYVNGVLQSGVSLGVTPEGFLSLRGKGTLISVL